MRILIVSQYFWPESFRINDLAVGLVERGHEVTVLTGQPNYPAGHYAKGYSFFTPQEEQHQGIRVLRVPLVPRFSGKGWQLALNYLSFVFFASLLAPFRCRGKFDIIFSYATSPITAVLPAILLRKIKKIPLIVWVQDLWPESVSATGAIKSERILGWIGKLVTFIYNHTDKILVSSQSFISSVKKYTINKDVDIAYFPNSVGSVYRVVSKNMNFKQQYNIPDGFIVMFAGNIGYAQDFPTILAAAERLKGLGDIHFVILGEGRHVDWVREQIVARELTHSVHLLGRHPMELMPDFFAHADVLLATLKDEPVFALTVPCKIQSYLACGKPILAALAGEGGQLVVEADAGISVQPGSPEALAYAVIKMQRMDQAQLHQYANNGLQYYQTHFMRDKLMTTLEGWLSAGSAESDVVTDAAGKNS